jgi:hypothetical protein
VGRESLAGDQIWCSIIARPTLEGKARNDEIPGEGSTVVEGRRKTAWRENGGDFGWRTEGAPCPLRPGKERSAAACALVGREPAPREIASDASDPNENRG